VAIFRPTHTTTEDTPYWFAKPPDMGPPDRILPAGTKVQVTRLERISALIRWIEGGPEAVINTDKTFPRAGDDTTPSLVTLAAYTPSGKRHITLKCMIVESFFCAHNLPDTILSETGLEASEARGGEHKKETCFTIMPFGGWFDQHFLDIYKPAIEAAGLAPRRADDLYRPGTIVHDIWEYTQNAKVILADLTGKNPNVFYEFGLGHALAKPVVLVTESVTDVPFDLRALRMIHYDKNNPDWGEALQEKIRTSILEVLQAPLKSVLPAFLNVRDSKADTSVTEHEREILEIRQEMELLRQEMIRSRD
jgi:hypothetical protein